MTSPLRSEVGDVGFQSSGGSESQWWSSIVDLAIDNPTFFTTAAGSYTGGCVFAPIKPLRVMGVRFYAKGIAGKSVKCSLWSPAAAQLATVTVVAGAVDGETRALFATPISLGAGVRSNAVYTVGMWVNDGSFYTATTNAAVLNVAQMNGPRVYVPANYTKYWQNGDALPDQLGAADCYPVEPILENP